MSACVVRSMRSFRAALTAVALAATLPSVAHTVWLEPRAGAPGEYLVTFGGHADRRLDYAPEKVRSVIAYAASGSPLPVRLGEHVRGSARAVTVAVDGQPVMIAVHFDNGIHARRSTGPSVEKPMDAVPGATKATRAVKYHKTIVAWTPSVARPLGQAFEVVPMSAEPPRAGVPLRARVLLDGRPASGVRVGHGDAPPAGAKASGDDGIVEYVPTPGFNRLWAGVRLPVRGNAQYTELSYEYVLGFDATP